VASRTSTDNGAARRMSFDRTAGRMSLDRGTGVRRSADYERVPPAKLIGDASEQALYRFCDKVKPLPTMQGESPKARCLELPIHVKR